MLTQERLKQVLCYDPDSGLFRWRERRGARGPAGEVAGTVGRHGYVTIGIDNKLHRAHRLAFLYMTGAMPRDAVDHINGEKADNRWANLRSATNSENLQNLRKARADSKTGLMGVRFISEGRWWARITVRGQRRSLGVHSTAEAAHSAYLSAKRQFHERGTI